MKATLKIAAASPLTIASVNVNSNVDVDVKVTATPPASHAWRAMVLN